MAALHQVLAQLRADRESGRLASIAGDLDIDLLVLFGSAVRNADRARDVDVAYLPQRQTQVDHLDVVNGLQTAYGDLLDGMPLHRAQPVARFRALHGVEVLVELVPDLYATTQMAAFREYCDTQPLRDLSLKVLATGSPRDLNPDVIQARLLLLRELLQDLDLLGEVTLEHLSSDRLARRALERILTQLVDLAADINTHVAITVADVVPTSHRSSFDLAVQAGLLSCELAERLKPSVGLRNVLMHDYVQTELGSVVRAVPLAREGYAEYVRQVARWLTGPGR